MYFNGVLKTIGIDYNIADNTKIVTFVVPLTVDTKVSIISAEPYGKPYDFVHPEEWESNSVNHKDDRFTIQLNQVRDRAVLVGDSDASTDVVSLLDNAIKLAKEYADESEVSATNSQNSANLSRDWAEKDTEVIAGHYSAKTWAESASLIAIPDGSVTTNKLADSAVTTIKIADNNITTSKIADNNITTIKIADNNITTSKIADNNITTIKIADNNITTSKIADASINVSKLSPLLNFFLDKFSTQEGISGFDGAYSMRMHIQRIPDNGSGVLGIARFTGVIDIGNSPALLSNMGINLQTAFRLIFQSSDHLGLGNIVNIANGSCGLRLEDQTIKIMGLSTQLVNEHIYISGTLDIIGGL